jgi:3-oxoacyl-[acyl-carrier-protein] synthase-3
MGFTISGFGRVSGAIRQDNEEIDPLFGMENGGLQTALKELGIRERHVVSGSETQLSLAVAACERAIQLSHSNEIDMIISATAVPYQPIPNFATLIAKKLGVEQGHVELLDINATCLSFLKALDIAAMHIDQGRHKRILIVSSETPSLSINETEDPKTAGIFSDGAAALVICPGETEISSFYMRSWPDVAGACEIPSGGTRYPAKTHPVQLVEHGFFRMNGKALMKATLSALPQVLETTLKNVDLKLEDLDLVIPHQGSPEGLELVRRRCNFPQESFLDLTATRGNRVAASLPDTLIHAITKNMIKPGSRTLLIGTAAGLSAGGMILTHENTTNDTE